ncbi:Uncharacterised protein [Mycobacterium tuberculosis]|uniref:hypothetical protein n=1 Tax=Mycobacterium tuberculosis TaxID=1773 RepID=UPI0009244137|nr:hypothetical protein [Mycobacterium tuberculosis]SGO82086.1 Uncharacterised protein [Mycobacterium tuberculosis]
MGKVKQLKNKPKENSEPGDVANMEWALAKFEAECFQLLGARLMDWFEIEENEVGFFWVDFGKGICSTGNIEKGKCPSGSRCNC